MSTVTLHIHIANFKWKEGFCKVRIYLRHEGEWLLAYVPEMVYYAKANSIDDAAIAHVKESLRSQGFILHDNVELSTTQQMVNNTIIAHHTEIYRIIASEG